MRLCTLKNWQHFFTTRSGAAKVKVCGENKTHKNHKIKMKQQQQQQRQTKTQNSEAIKNKKNLFKLRDGSVAVVVVVIRLCQLI